MADRAISPWVKTCADRYGVDLSTVTGTGAGGRISKNDVLARARELGTARTSIAPSQPRAALPSVQARTRTYMSVWGSWAQWGGSQVVEIDPWARNPLVDDARQAVPEVYDRAVAAGPAPTLFKAGDVPLWIASGADPQLLLQLPAMARHAGAQADAVGFAQILETYTGADAAEKAFLEFGGFAGDWDYYSRVLAWLKSSTPSFLG
jgi:hypothetical protein